LAQSSPATPALDLALMEWVAGMVAVVLEPMCPIRV
jgi:hypothetical protein